MDFVGWAECNEAHHPTRLEDWWAECGEAYHPTWLEDWWASLHSAHPTKIDRAIPTLVERPGWHCRRALDTMNFPRGASDEGGTTMRVGIGHDTHRLVEGRPLILGGVRIEHPRGLMGHSDADVVLHALADALLGAAALGDIGEHFPDTDPKWKGLAGDTLMRAVLERIAGAGWAIGNCDIVIHAQQPKLTPHKPAIKAHIAELLGVTPDSVNVKAKTGEHVGPIGRGEAISCEAVVLLDPKRTQS